MPQWIELSVEADSESVEAVSELLGRYGYNHGVAIQEAFQQGEDGDDFSVDPTQPVVVTTYLPEDAHMTASRRAIEEGLWYLGRIGNIGELVVTPRADEDWENAWKDHFHVLRIGKRFVVKPTWCDYDPRPDDLVIHLDPGMAFGTGSHPSTEMCLVLLENIDVSGRRVLDVGAGSGILSIAALLLDAQLVDAVEIDPYAFKTLTANLELNERRERATPILGPVSNVLAPDAVYDVVLANLIASVLIGNIAPITSHVGKDGVIIASGVIEEHLSKVLENFKTHGFRPTDTRQVRDWVTLRFERST